MLRVALLFLLAASLNAGPPASQPVAAPEFADELLDAIAVSFGQRAFEPLPDFPAQLQTGMCGTWRNRGRLRVTESFYPKAHAAIVWERRDLELGQRYFLMGSGLSAEFWADDMEISPGSSQLVFVDKVFRHHGRAYLSLRVLTQKEEHRLRAKLAVIAASQPKQPPDPPSCVTMRDLEATFEKNLHEWPVHSLKKRLHRGQAGKLAVSAVRVELIVKDGCVAMVDPGDGRERRVFLKMDSSRLSVGGSVEVADAVWAVCEDRQIEKWRMPALEYVDPQIVDAILNRRGG